MIVAQLDASTSNVRVTKCIGTSSYSEKRDLDQMVVVYCRMLNFRESFITRVS